MTLSQRNNQYKTESFRPGADLEGFVDWSQKTTQKTSDDLAGFWKNLHVGPRSDQSHWSNQHRAWFFKSDSVRKFLKSKILYGMNDNQSKNINDHRWEQRAYLRYFKNSEEISKITIIFERPNAEIWRWSDHSGGPLTWLTVSLVLQNHLYS